MTLTAEQMERARSRAADWAWDGADEGNVRARLVTRQPAESPPAPPEPTCCELAPYLRGMCRRHYWRWHRKARAGRLFTRGVPTSAVINPG
jgi:hypothetical protein